LRERIALNRRRSPRNSKTALEENMTELNWTAPEACEVCVGMEVTSYMSAAL
jgi:coenzyme PQQ precursor peptide PqqA